MGSLNHVQGNAHQQQMGICEVARKPDITRTSQNRRDSPIAVLPELNRSVNERLEAVVRVAADISNRKNRRRHPNRRGRRCHACPLKNSYLFRLGRYGVRAEGPHRN